MRSAVQSFGEADRKQSRCWNKGAVLLVLVATQPSWLMGAADVCRAKSFVGCELFHTSPPQGHSSYAKMRIHAHLKSLLHHRST